VQATNAAGKRMMGSSRNPERNSFMHNQ
jgi:hypothetical protein